MATIIYSTEDIGDAYAPSLNAALEEIHAASGIIPSVLSPLGGLRTLAQELALHGSPQSDHVKGRAVDINNQRQLRNWNEPKFLAILAAHGWHNIQIDGAPFPAEPWHFANHSTVPASEGSHPIPPQSTQEDNAMYAFSYTSATAGVCTFIAAPGLYVKGCAATEPAALGIPVHGPLTLSDLNAAMWNLGFDDQVGGAVDAWSFLSKHCHPGTVFTTAWAKAQAPTTVA